MSLETVHAVERELLARGYLYDRATDRWEHPSLTRSTSAVWAVARALLEGSDPPRRHQLLAWLDLHLDGRVPNRPEICPQKCSACSHPLSWSNLAWADGERRGYCAGCLPR